MRYTTQERIQMALDGGHLGINSAAKRWGCSPSTIRRQMDRAEAGESLEDGRQTMGAQDRTKGTGEGNDDEDESLFEWPACVSKCTTRCPMGEHFHFDYGAEVDGEIPFGSDYTEWDGEAEVDEEIHGDLDRDFGDGCIVFGASEDDDDDDDEGGYRPVRVNFARRNGRARRPIFNSWKLPPAARRRPMGLQRNVSPHRDTSPAIPSTPARPAKRTATPANATPADAQPPRPRRSSRIAKNRAASLGR